MENPINTNKDLIRRSQILLLSYFKDAFQRWHLNPLVLQLGQLFVLSRIYLWRWAFFRPSSFQFGSSPSGGTYSLAILFFSCTEVLLLFLVRLKLFSFNSLLNRCPNFTFGDLQDVAQDAKTIEASSSSGLSSPSNRQITLLCWWPGKKERPMTDYILNRVFSSPLHSMAIMWKWHNTALAKKSVKQISETFGIEFISFLCRTNMWPTPECSCWLTRLAFPNFVVCYGPTGFVLVRPQGYLTIQFKLSRLLS